jgi:glutathione S-transferase
MSALYRVFGSELSPYSVKVRSYFRYKDIPHQWVVRNRETMAEFQDHARLPLIPLVIAPDGAAMQDSTPILESLEARFLEPSIHPADPALAFLSALIEEYGDEWANKPMFHYRWTYEADQSSTGARIAQENAPGTTGQELEALTRMIIDRMVPRLSFVGSSDATRGQIERSFRRQLAHLEPHLAHRPYLFGGRPSFADFGLALQLHQCTTDPTPSRIIATQAPGVRVWAERMLDPKDEGDFERWEELEPTLLPFLTDEVGGVFLPWSRANARAIEQNAAEFTVEIEGEPFTQSAQKYHAKSLAALRARYAAVPEKSRLDSILERVDCLSPLS